MRKGLISLIELDPLEIHRIRSMIVGGQGGIELSSLLYLSDIASSRHMPLYPL